MSGLSITFCALLSFAGYIDRRRCASPGEETTLGGTAYVSNKIFNASNFLMVASQANHPLLRQSPRNSLYFEFLLLSAAGCLDEGETHCLQLSPAVCSSSSSPSSSPSSWSIIVFLTDNTSHSFLVFYRIMTSSYIELMYFSQSNVRILESEKYFLQIQFLKIYRDIYVYV